MLMGGYTVVHRRPTPGPWTLISSQDHPVPNSGLAAEMPAREENMSGAPLPRAIMVTPATFWDSLETKNATV